MNEFIKYKVIDHIAWITMKRNPSNAFNIEFLDEILNTLKIASKDKDVSVIIIESDINKIFSAGLDLNLLLNKSGLEIIEDMSHNIIKKVVDKKYYFYLPYFFIFILNNFLYLYCSFFTIFKKDE